MGGKGAQTSENGDDLVSSLSGLEVDEQLGQGWGGDDDMEWLETKEEAKERTIIDLLEKDEMELENGVWEKEDETINLIPSAVEESEVEGTAASSSKSRPEMAKKLLRRKGKWVRSSTGKGRDSFKWVASESEFDKKATKILQRFWLHGTLSRKDEAHDWNDMVAMEAGALSTVEDLVSASTKSRVDPSKVRITKIGTEEVFLNHLVTLQRGRWIHSSLVNAWNALISKDAGHVCFSSKLLPLHLVWILDSFFYDHLAGVVRNSNGSVVSIEGLDLEKGKRVFRNQRLGHVSRVLIPINLNNEHWIAASLNIEQRTISICDSLGGKHPAVARNLTAWFIAAFGEGDSSPTVDYAPVQKQVEADCGVAAIMYILSLIHI